MWFNTQKKNHTFTENITIFSPNKTAQFLITELVNDIIEKCQYWACSVDLDTVSRQAQSKLLGFC